MRALLPGCVRSICLHWRMLAQSTLALESASGSDLPSYVRKLHCTPQSRYMPVGDELHMGVLHSECACDCA